MVQWKYHFASIRLNGYYCESCPAGFTDFFRLARDILNIVVGGYSVKTYGCIRCPEDWYKHEMGDGSCKPCFGNAAGSILPSSELDLITYKASSTYGDKFSADKAATEDGYWCSESYSESPQYWWISFKKVGMGAEIVKITFEEIYPGAQYEFIASDTNECTKTGRTLISGTQEQINGQILENGKLHHCYGLKITNLPNTKKWGHLATLKRFRFFVRPPGNTNGLIGMDRCFCPDNYDFVDAEPWAAKCVQKKNTNGLDQDAEMN